MASIGVSGMSAKPGDAVRSLSVVTQNNAQVTAYTSMVVIGVPGRYEKPGESVRSRSDVTQSHSERSLLTQVWIP